MLNSIQVVGSSVLTLFLMMAVGFILGKLGMLSKDTLSQLSKLLLCVVSPAIMVDTFLGEERTAASVRNLLIAGAVLAVALIVCFFTVHIWVDATCSRPKHCALCGKTQGRALPHEFEPATCEDPEICEVCGDTGEEALGHSWQEATCQAPRTCTRCGHTEGVPSGHGWQDATCTKPSTCATCGATQGSALGHDWKEATYEAPKTCRRCGATEGSIRGYYAEAPSHSIRFHTNTVSGWAQEFDSYYTDVYRFTIHVEITDVSYGSAEGRWEAFYRTSGGAWVSLGYFELTGDEASVTFTLEDPTDVTAVAAVIAKGGNFSFSKLCYVTDLYCYD